MSRALVTCCRHRGCFDSGSTLGCDSGGWYVLHNLVKEVYRVSPYKNSWASKINSLLIQGKSGTSDPEVAKMLYLSTFPTRHYDKARFEVIIEVDREGRDCRPYAIRACSGHSACSIIDPLRIAGIPDQRCLQMTPGLFHMTRTS